MVLVQLRRILLSKYMCKKSLTLKSYPLLKSNLSYNNVNSLPFRNIYNKKSLRPDSVKFSSDREEFGQVPILTQGINKLNSIFSTQDVETLKEMVLSKGSHITKINFDSMFITVCSQEHKFQLGKEYFNFVYSKGDCNIGVIGKFFRLCYDCKEECSDYEKSLMFDLYKMVIDKYQILDSKTCENLGLGLSITTNWKEGLKLLEMTYFTAVPSLKMYSALIQAAFNNNEINLGLNLLHEMAKKNHIPHAEVFISWLSALKFKHSAFIDIFKFLELYDFHPSEQLVRLILDYYKKYIKTSERSEITTVDSRGKCRSCFNKLNSLVVTNADFQKLKDAFLDPVLIGKDIFLKTKPGEFQSYFNYLKKLDNVDVVLDGLNIALSPTQRAYNVELSSQVLCNVVQHFIKQSKKVLVLGRKHMNYWPKAKMNYIKQNSFLFLVENVTVDDPFLLYATMYFGLGTHFVSRDQMRGHRFLLKDPDLISIFSKWQQKHQYYFLYASENGNVAMKDPLPYIQSVQQTKTGIWHIPIATDFSGIPAHLIPIKRKWLCFHET